jgi:endonuclease-3
LPRQASYAQANLLSFFSRPPPQQPKEEGDKGRARLEIGYAQTQQPTTNEKEKAEEDTLKGQEEREEEKEEEEVEMKKGGRVAQQLMWRCASSFSAGRPGPNGWREVWDGIVRYRAEHKAPVDTMGCGSMANRGASPQVQRFQTLVGLMLSSQTRDQSTAKAMRQLQDSLAGGVNVSSVMATPEEDIAALIKPVTYFTQKAKNIKKVAEILHTRHQDDIPATFKGLTDLPGVGPKMSHLCMQYAWGKTEGIGVDVHVHRISNRLGWVRSTTPEATRKQLEEWLPREHWKTINNLFVGFGQLICTPTHPKCAQCPVNTLCPTGRTNLSLVSAPLQR